MKTSNRNRSKATRGRAPSGSSTVPNSPQWPHQKRAASLEDAIELALKVHRGVTDKAGVPYILHVLRVMFAVEGETARLAAALHDVIEDSEYTLADLRELGFPDEVVDTVDALSRRPGEPYDAFIRRAAAHPTARLIKLADLEDNLDLRRLARFDESDWHRLQRYRQAWQVLKNGGA